MFDLLIRLESFTNIFSNVLVYHEVLQGKMRSQSFLPELDSNYRHVSRNLYADELLDRTFSFKLIYYTVYKTREGKFLEIGRYC